MIHKARIKLIQNILSDNALDAFLVLTKINRQYLSGFTGSAGIMLVTRKGAKLFVDDRYLIRAKRESPIPVHSLEILSSGNSGVKKGDKIGIEDNISLRDFEWLRKILKAKYVPTSNVIENIRAVKTSREIAMIKKAQKLIDYIFNYVIKYATKAKHNKKNLTESALSLEMERYAKKLGAEGMAFESIVASGANAAAPHHLSGKQKIKNNNFLLLDFGVLLDGYHSDFTRTLFIGKPDKRQERVYNIVLQAQARAFEKIKAGEQAAMIDSVARGHIERAGFRKYYTHNSGHGVGLEIHELPNLSQNSKDILQENSIVTVEPGIYIERWGGVRIEDMVIVEENAGKAISKIPRDFRSMIIK